MTAEPSSVLRESTQDQTPSERCTPTMGELKSLTFRSRLDELCDDVLTDCTHDMDRGDFSDQCPRCAARHLRRTLRLKPNGWWPAIDQAGQ